MPAPISFAFPEAIAATAPSVADGVASGSASAAAFGQLIDAATATNGGLTALTALAAAPQQAELIIPAAVEADELLQPQAAEPTKAEALLAGKDGEPLAELPLTAMLEKPKAPQAHQPSDAVQAKPDAVEAKPDAVETKPDAVEAKPAAEMLQTAEPKHAEIEDAPAPDDHADVPQEPILAAMIAPKPEAPQPQAAAHILTSLAPTAPVVTDGAARDADDGAADPIEAAPVHLTARRKADHHAAAQSIAAPSDAGAEEAQPVRAPSTAQVHAAQIAAPKMEVPEASLPAALLTQTMAPISANVTSNPYPVPAALMNQVPVVAARAGQMGTNIGVEIAKVAKGDGDSLLIRLDPRDMGRVDVRLSFDKDGVLRAVMSVDSPSALEMLRRESGDLNRALADAGVRSDAQSLRFDARSGDGAGHGGPPWRDARSGGGRSPADQDSFGEQNSADYKPLRTSSQIDLIA